MSQMKCILKHNSKRWKIGFLTNKLSWIVMHKEFFVDCNDRRFHRISPSRYIIFWSLKSYQINKPSQFFFLEISLFAECTAVLFSRMSSGLGDWSGLSLAFRTVYIKAYIPPCGNLNPKLSAYSTDISNRKSIFPFFLRFV